ncbi:hypothetical protein [Streptomyces sp. NPDC002602]|uniref:hypothetical protein n=1 Tax=Streptomyces sp. NPDC002602 TaxID=3364654 RepID=UPI0036A3A109
MHVPAVHDNKRTGQQRLSRITHREGSNGVSPITWDGPETVDLEAVEAVHGTSGEYLVLTGRGIAYRLKVNGSTGVECLPGSADAVLGTDDENLGGYLRTMSYCGA